MYFKLTPIEDVEDGVMEQSFPVDKNGILHLMVPIPSDNIVISEEELRELLGEAYQAGVSFDLNACGGGSAMPTKEESIQSIIKKATKQ